MDFAWKNKAVEIITELRAEREKKIEVQWSKNRRHINEMQDQFEKAYKTEPGYQEIHERSKMLLLKPVETLPKKSTYVYLPRNEPVVKEAQYNNIPYLGEHLLDDKKFVDRIVRIFGNQTESFHHDRRLDDAMFIDLVDKMKQLGPNTHITRTGDPIPMPIIFQTIIKIFPKMGDPDKLKEKYLTLTRHRANDNKCEVNVDPVETLKKLFCRRCFIYNCTLHVDPEDKADPMPKNARKDQITLPTEPCGTNCYLTIESKSKELNLCAGDILKSWSVADRSLVKFLREIFGKNYCEIAEIFATEKTCLDVYKLDQVDPILEATNPEDGDASKRPKKPKRRNTHAVTKVSIDDKYYPCKHEGRCDGACSCVRNETFCEKFCGCPKDCKYRFPGCKCKAQCNSAACPCFAANRECDPDLCRNFCGADAPTTESKANINCKNVALQRKFNQHILFSISKLENAGWGVFAKTDIKKNDFIFEYAGEIISQEESDRRGIIYEKSRCSYLFEINKTYVLDATLKGNKSRFVNHSHKPNCHPRFKLVNGDYRIGIYAKCDIKAGEELLFNYRYANQDKIKFFGASGPN